MNDADSLEQSQLDTPTLGPRKVRSPLALSNIPNDGIGDFMPDEARLLFEPRLLAGDSPNPLVLEQAGPREQIFFDPRQVKAAIVTCGGLCPGINNVIRTAVFELMHNYGVPEVLGIRFGYEGLNPDICRPPIRLTCEAVENIHYQGGTILGTSRGPQEAACTVDFLVSEGVNILL